MVSFAILIITMSLIIHAIASPPSCFSCSSISHARYCDVYTQCDDGEVCYVKKSESDNGHFQYTSGCISNKTCGAFVNNVTSGLRSSSHGQYACRECCHGDMCNNKGCGDDGSCDDHYKAGSVKSGVYTISPDDVNTFDVYCDMEDGDGGWIVLQHRFDGSVLFERTFAEYENGFGQLDGEFWLGLKKMYILAHSSRKVKFNLQALNGTWLPLEYGNFSISDASQQYTLHVSNHILGFESRSFIYNNGYKFSTYDRDTKETCAARRFGGFWYAYCTYLNINGHFGMKGHAESGVIVEVPSWIHFQKTLMMIQ